MVIKLCKKVFEKCTKVGACICMHMSTGVKEGGNCEGARGELLPIEMVFDHFLGRSLHAFLVLLVLAVHILVRMWSWLAEGC